MTNFEPVNEYEALAWSGVVEATTQIGGRHGQTFNDTGLKVTMTKLNVAATVVMAAPDIRDAAASGSRQEVTAQFGGLVGSVAGSAVGSYVGTGLVTVVVGATAPA